MKDIINCTKCKRPILEHEADEGEGVGYCRGCNFYFLLSDKVDRKRKEIIIPNRSSYIRLTLEENSLEMTIRWFRNYSLRKFTIELLSENLSSIIYLGAYFINKTTVKVEKGVLEVKHTPFDLLPYIYYNASYVKQLYVKKMGGWFFKTHGMYAKLSDGREEKLLWDLDKNVLLFIEQEIERIFGIEDEKVEGEVVE